MKRIGFVLLLSTLLCAGAEAQAPAEGVHGESHDKAPVATNTASTPNVAAETVDSAKQAPARARASDPKQCLADETAIEDVRKRRDELELKTKELSAREAELVAREKALEEELKKISQVRDDIARIEGAARAQNETKISRIVETVEAMNPKAAAKMLAALDETLAVGAIERLSTPKLGKIMNLLEPETSSRLNEVMAGVVRARGIQKRSSSSSMEGRPVSLNTAATANTGKGGEKNERTNDDPSASQTSNGSPARSEVGTAKP